MTKFIRCNLACSEFNFDEVPAEIKSDDTFLYHDYTAVPKAL